MSCPVCGNPTAPNAFAGDNRCGPCHNFGIAMMLPDGHLVVRASRWAEVTKSACQQSGTYDNTYKRWIDAVVKAAEARER